MTDELKHHRAVYDLGKRAIDYYVDTGLCVFCDADDCAGRPHEDHCDVGELAGVTVDHNRREEKAAQRAIADAMMGVRR